MSEKTTPRTRDEKEIAGYRDALNTVHENFEYIPLTPNYILQLHKIMFARRFLQERAELYQRNNGRRKDLCAVYASGTV